MQNLLIDINDYVIMKEIGRGSFGSVYLVQNKVTQQEYAAKVCSINDDSKTSNFKLTGREILIMMRLNNPAIIKFYGYSKTDFTGKNNIVLFLEFAKNKSLADFLSNDNKDSVKNILNNTIRQKNPCWNCSWYEVSL